GVSSSSLSARSRAGMSVSFIKKRLGNGDQPGDGGRTMVRPYPIRRNRVATEPQRGSIPPARLWKPTPASVARPPPDESHAVRAAGRSVQRSPAPRSPRHMATTRPPARHDHTPASITPRTTPPLGRRVLANLPTAELVQDAIRAGEGLIAAEGPLVVRTGKHTGRSPQDKFIVDEPPSTGKIWWGDVNHPISEANYDRLRARLVAHCAEKDLYSQ